MCYTSTKAHFSPCLPHSLEKRSKWARKGFSRSTSSPRTRKAKSKNEIFKAIHWTWQSVAAYNQNIKTSLRENAVFRSIYLFHFVCIYYKTLFTTYFVSSHVSIWCWNRRDSTIVKKKSRDIFLGACFYIRNNFKAKQPNNFNVELGYSSKTTFVLIQSSDCTLIRINRKTKKKKSQ
jgi:hypothetical protein